MDTKIGTSIMKMKTQWKSILKETFNIVGAISQPKKYVKETEAELAPEMEYCASATSMLAENFCQIAEGFVEVPINL